MWQLDEFHFEIHLTRKVKTKLQGCKPTTIKIKTSFHKPVAKLNIDFFFQMDPTHLQIHDFWELFQTLF